MSTSPPRLRSIEGSRCGGGRAGQLLARRALFRTRPRPPARPLKACPRQPRGTKVTPPHTHTHLQQRKRVLFWEAALQLAQRLGARGVGRRRGEGAQRKRRASHPAPALASGHRPAAEQGAGQAAPQNGPACLPAPPPVGRVGLAPPAESPPPGQHPPSAPAAPSLHTQKGRACSTSRGSRRSGTSCRMASTSGQRAPSMARTCGCVCVARA